MGRKHLFMFRLRLLAHVLAGLPRLVARRLYVGLTAMPVAGGSPEGDGEGEGSGDGGGEGEGAGSGEGGASGDGEGEGDGDGGGDGGDGDGDGTPATPQALRAELEKTRGELRKHRGTERRAKESEKKVRDLEAKLKEFADRDKSEQEKALEKAREDAKAEVESKYETERRDDKIESAVTKLALGGFKVKDGDEEKTYKFEDPDDAQLRLERALRNGDLTYDAVYSDGKADKDAITEFLRELLEDNPRMRADTKPAKKVEGGADAGKGKGGGGGEKSAAEIAKEMAVK